MKYSTHILLFLLCFSFSYTAFAQGITESDYYKFLNSIKGEDTSKTNFISSKPTCDYFISDTSILFHGNIYNPGGKGDSLFNESDIKFMKQQIAQANGHTWKSQKITWATIIPQKEIDKIFSNSKKDKSTKFYKKYPTKIFYDYSIPLFSANKLLCAIYIGSYCGGLCGSGAFYIYQYKGDKWIWIRYYRLWIS